MLIAIACSACCACPFHLPQKAKVLYDAIAGSGGFYNSPVDPGAHSPC
jgi:hypothetical protein